VSYTYNPPQLRPLSNVGLNGNVSSVAVVGTGKHTCVSMQMFSMDTILAYGNLNMRYWIGSMRTLLNECFVIAILFLAYRLRG
jgi:hypothetical protein